MGFFTWLNKGYKQNSLLQAKVVGIPAMV